MKKVLLVATGLAVLSTGAYASKARVNALQNSFLLTDTTNILTNPAELNNMKNFVITEWGKDDSTAAQTTAEGGFFKDAGKFAYGFYFGNDNDNSFNSDRQAANFLQRDNTLNLFFAGDMGIQWGAKVAYASAKDEQTNTYKKDQSSVGLALGAIWKDLKVNADIDVKDESKGDNTSASYKWENKLGYDIAAKYAMMGFEFFGNYQSHGYDKTLATKDEYTVTEWSVGAGKTHEVAKTARLFTDVKWTSGHDKTKGGTPDENWQNALKATVGFEADATSWLVLRGAFSGKVIGYNKDKNKKKQTDVDQSDVSAGATLNFGQLKVDGMIGDNAGAGDNGQLRTDTLLTQVAVHYWF